MPESLAKFSPSPGRLPSSTIPFSSSSPSFLHHHYSALPFPTLPDLKKEKNFCSAPESLLALVWGGRTDHGLGVSSTISPLKDRPLCPESQPASSPPQSAWLCLSKSNPQLVLPGSPPGPGATPKVSVRRAVCTPTPQCTRRISGLSSPLAPSRPLSGTRSVLGKQVTCGGLSGLLGEGTRSVERGRRGHALCPAHRAQGPATFPPTLVPYLWE